MAPFIAYYRVSTQRQGASGLGLDAQRTAVTEYLRGQLPAVEFTEIESGKKTDHQRPKLAAAIEACRLYRGRLVVAKLDRLARNAYFLHQLKASGIEFVCCDMPDANHLTISILAAVAEDEARRISERTKAALDAAKRRGRKLGNPGNLKRQAEGRILGTLARQARAKARAEELKPVIDSLRGEGRSLRAIASELCVRRIPSARGGRWTASAVSRVLRVLGAVPPDRHA